MLCDKSMQPPQRMTVPPNSYHYSLAQQASTTGYTQTTPLPPLQLCHRRLVIPKPPKDRPSPVHALPVICLWAQTVPWARCCCCCWWWCPAHLLLCAAWCCELNVLVGIIQAGPDECCHAAVNNNEVLVAIGLHTWTQAGTGGRGDTTSNCEHTRIVECNTEARSSTNN